MGFIPDRDFRSTAASSEKRVQTSLGQTAIMFAASDRSFGADRFYGDFPSWEGTKNWFGSVQQELGDRTTAAFGYRRRRQGGRSGPISNWPIGAIQVTKRFPVC